LYDSFDRLYFLATLAMSFMTWLLHRLPSLSRHLIPHFSKPSQRKVPLLPAFELAKPRFHPTATDPIPPKLNPNEWPQPFYT
jgi:hypothetical protein